MSLSSDDLAQRMRKLVFSGLLGDAKDRMLVWDTVEQDKETTLYIASLIPTNGRRGDNHRKHLIKLQNSDGSLLAKIPAELSETELAQATKDAGIGVLQKFVLFHQGGYGVTYKVDTGHPERGTEEYIIQLRYHGNVGSMNHLISYLYTNHSKVVPVPQAFPSYFVPKCGMKVQISRFIPGTGGPLCYPYLSKEAKFGAVKQIARAYGTLWDLQIPRPRNLIGEAIVQDTPFSVSVGPDRRYQLGGPFSTVSSFLQAWIQNRFRKLENQLNNDKSNLSQIERKRKIVEDKLSAIPKEVEDVPVVITHGDMSLHNMLFSPEDPTKLMAIVDWEFIHCVPFAVSIPTFINPLFAYGEAEVNRDGRANSTMDEDLRSAFWAEIPRWEVLANTTACRSFLDLYQFGLDLKLD
ncbi:Fc.00g097010.m01.CDS01 [Cosmosporella sp. VM-42]